MVGLNCWQENQEVAGRLQSVSCINQIMKNLQTINMWFIPIGDIDLTVWSVQQEPYQTVDVKQVNVIQIVVLNKQKKDCQMKKY